MYAVQKNDEFVWMDGSEFNLRKLGIPGEGKIKKQKFSHVTLEEQGDCNIITAYETKIRWRTNKLGENHQGGTLLVCMLQFPIPERVDGATVHGSSIILVTAAALASQMAG